MTELAAGSEPASIRQMLRTRTAALHARVDARMGPLLSGSDRDYGRFLTVSAQAVLPLEQALADRGVATILPDWHDRSRSAALRDDLTAWSLPEPSTAAVETPGQEAWLFGVLYVLEGSRLGARVLLRDMQAAAQPLRRPVRYLSHGQGLPLWQTFLKRLEASDAVRASPEVVVDGATAAFARFV